MRENDDKLRIWREVEPTDPKYTKPFNRGGGFRGTATNATYLARRATEMFGPIGIGWGIEIADEDVMFGAPLQTDNDGNVTASEMVHKVRVRLWYKHPDTQERGEVYQFGQTTFVGRNKNGLFTDEEAPKKSLTDGMSKCLSLLGFSADIHMGRFDDNKYVDDRRQQADAEREAQERANAPKVSAEQAADIAELIEKTETDRQKFVKFFRIGSLGEMPEADYEKAKRILENKLSKQGA